MRFRQPIRPIMPTGCPPRVSRTTTASIPIIDNEVILLLQENARLRALVTQLSSLVLKHVVDGK